jgi:hypothetical protein
MRSQWKNLQGVYAELAASPPTYELISGAIAMSRMARALGDEPMQQRFATEAVKLMQAGRSFETFRRNAHLAYSGKPDCYYLQNLVTAIESLGQSRWVESLKP